MKKYPKIYNWDPEMMVGERVVAFDKLDGTNVYATWNSKRGFYEFGTREMLPDGSDRVLGEAIMLIKHKYEKELQEIFTKNGWKDVTCFFELHGEHSFAGTHQDEDHEVVLLDVSAGLEGLLPAGEFVKTFQDEVEIPTVLYVGICTQKFIDDIKAGLVPGVTFEGAVIKGFSDNLMVKVKSDAWVEKLQEFCAGDHSAFRKFYSSG